MRRNWWVIAAIAVLALPALVSAQRRALGTAKLHSQEVAGKRTWPALHAVMRTDSVVGLIDCAGHIGWNQLPYFQQDPFVDTVWMGISAPPQSGVGYLFDHGLWLGGVLGNDTLVSDGTGGNIMNGGELYPTSYAPGHFSGNIMPFAGPADQCYWTQYADTLIPGLSRQPEWDEPFVPLNLVVSDRAYAWRSGLAARTLLHDYVITNVGHDTIRGFYIGMRIEPGIVTPDDSFLIGTGDDLVGSFPGANICYAIDNDGDPRDDVFLKDTSTIRALGIKVEAIYPPAHDTGFNWTGGWDDGATYYGFAPRRLGDNRELGTNGSVHAQGSASRYYLLRTKGWDYDQVLTGTIGPSDSVWQYPGVGERCHYGSAVSFLYSFGGYNLPPDSSVRFILTTFVSSQAHHDPHIADFLLYAPELYTANLDFSGLFASARMADSLSAVLTDPRNAPTGLRLLKLAGDSATVEWDPWVMPNTDGYNLYLVEIPREAFQREGVVPPLFRPTTLPEPVRLGGERQYIFRNLSPFKAYACFIANRIGEGEGALSSPVTFKLPSPAVAPSMTSRYCYFSSSSVAGFPWEYSKTASIAHFNVYRFADSTAETKKFAAYYSINELAQSAQDSLSDGRFVYHLYAMPVYATVDSGKRGFVDSAACNGCTYVVTAVDTAGFESVFSSPVYTKQVNPKSRDILVLTCSGGVYTFVTCDTIKAFYEAILSGYDYDVYHYSDSVVNSDCLTHNSFCSDWLDFTRYRLVIIDDGIRDAILTANYEATTLGFTHYLQSGGRLACFGPLASAGQTLGPTLGPGAYWRSVPLVHNLLGVDSVLFMGTFYYRFNTVLPYVDSLLGFARAEGTAPDIPSVTFDSLRYPFTEDLIRHWPVGTPPSASAFVPNVRAHPTHLFRSVYPASSLAEGKPAGLVTVVDSSAAFTFGFHLWYMNPTEARQLIDWIMQQVPTGIDDRPEEQRPTTIALSQNYPNPFNATTQIQFVLPSADHISLEIFNIAGQRVRTLQDRDFAAGAHSVVWDGKSEADREVASGVYLYRLRGCNSSLCRKMLLLK